MKPSNGYVRSSRVWCGIAILFFFSVVSLFAQDVSIQDFRIPYSSYQKFLGSLNGALSHNEWDNSSVDLYHYVANSDQKNMQLYGALNYIYDENDENHAIDLQVSTEMSHQENKSNGNSSNNYDNTSQNDNRNIYSTINFASSASYSTYFIPDEWFVIGGIQGSVMYNEQKNNSNYTYYGILNYTTDSLGQSIPIYGTDQTTSEEHNINRQQNAAVSAGIGYGKIRNGAAVFAIVRILEKLEEDGALTRELTKEEILDLVSVYAKKMEYVYSHDRFTKYFMQDLFDRLEQMGVLKNRRVATYSVLRSAEVLNENIQARNFGWQITMTLERNVGNYFYNYSYSNQNYSYRNDELKCALMYGYPVSLNWQLNAKVEVALPGVDYKRKSNYSAFVGCVYQMTDRILANVGLNALKSNQLLGSSNDQSNFNRAINYFVSIGLTFFIEDRVNFNITSSYLDQSISRYSDSNVGKTSNVTPSLRFSLGYRFL